MYTLQIRKELEPARDEIERIVRHLAAHLESRHSEITMFCVHVGLSRPRTGPEGFRVRISLEVAGGKRRTVIGQSLEHLRAALRTTFDAADVHLNHHARDRRDLRSRRSPQFVEAH